LFFCANGGAGTSNQIYNNVFYIKNTPDVLIWQKPHGIFSNNIFYLASGLNRLSDATLDQDAEFHNNCFYPGGTFSKQKWGTAVLKNNFYNHPSFVDTTWSIGLESAKGFAVSTSASARSICLGAGALIKNNGGKDFLGSLVPEFAKPDVGAFQSPFTDTPPPPPPTKTLDATADAYVYDGDRKANFGTSNALVVKGDADGYKRKAYVKFDLNTVPVSTINEATLSFYVGSVGSSGDRTISIYATKTKDWEEKTINWNNSPTEATLIGTIKVSRTGFFTLDVSKVINTQLVQKDYVISFLLQNNKIQNGRSDININSREAPDNQPKLSISY
jgi:hypothetical protein